MSSKFTCISCRVSFSNGEVQRQHYKSDWHRYNLKRKVAELPPVSAEEFQRRVLVQRQQDEADKKNNSVYCIVCRKTFSSSQSFQNHLKSKKHLSLAGNLPDQDTVLPIPSVEHVPRNKKSDVPSTTSVSEYDSDIEEVDSDEWDEEFSEDNPIFKNDCIFCSHHSANMTKNIKHMTEKHSFFIPDVEYVVDLKGLLCYLGEKIVKGYMCIWCNDSGKSFFSAEAAQQHMTDKGHCKMLHEGEALLEYADYYDYSSSYPDATGEVNTDDEVSVPVIEEEDYQLILPSGSIIGHRSLMRYYRQNFDPNRVVVPLRKKNDKIIAQYKALGWAGADKQAVVKKARDLRFMQRVQNKYNMKLGIKANNLSVKRPQVNF